MWVARWDGIHILRKLTHPRMKAKNKEVTVQYSLDQLKLEPNTSSTYTILNLSG